MTDNSKVEPLLKSLTGMGSLQKVYEQRRTSPLNEKLSIFFVIFLSSLAIFLYWSLYKTAHVITKDIALTILSIPFFLFLVIVSTRKYLSRWNDSAVVYQDGFAYSHQNLITSFKWIEITGISILVTKMWILGIIPAWVIREYWIASDLAKVRLATTIENVDGLLADIRKNSFPHLFNRMKSEFDSGKGIDFGSVIISKNSIQAHEKVFSWTEFSQVALDRGIVHFVAKKRNPVNDLRLSLQYLENVDVLVALSNEWIKQTSFKGN